MSSEQTEIRTLDHVDQYLMVGKESNASDIHLAVNSRPIWRRFGNLEAIWLQAPVLTAADTERLAMGFLTEAQKQIMAERGDVDFAYANAQGRFHYINFYSQRRTDLNDPYVQSVFNIANEAFRTAVSGNNTEAMYFETSAYDAPAIAAAGFPRCT